MAPLSGLLITEPKQGKTGTDAAHEWGNNGGKVTVRRHRDHARASAGPCRLYRVLAEGYEGRQEGYLHRRISGGQGHRLPGQPPAG